MQQRLRYPKLKSAYGSSRKNPGTGFYISHNAAQSYCFFFVMLLAEPQKT